LELWNFCTWDLDNWNEEYGLSRCNDLGFKTLLASDSSEYTSLQVDIMKITKPYLKYSTLTEGTHHVKLQPYNKDSGATFGNIWSTDGGISWGSTTNDFTFTI
jgi:hypothetical protein